MIGKNFKIDKNIPVPFNSSQSTIVTTARAMEVGDSVFVDDRNHFKDRFIHLLDSLLKLLKFRCSDCSNTRHVLLIKATEIGADVALNDRVTASKLVISISIEAPAVSAGSS